MTEYFRCLICNDLIGLEWGDDKAKSMLDHIFNNQSQHKEVLVYCIIPLFTSWMKEEPLRQVVCKCGHEVNEHYPFSTSKGECIKIGCGCKKYEPLPAANTTEYLQRINKELGQELDKCRAKAKIYDEIIKMIKE